MELATNRNTLGIEDKLVTSQQTVLTNDVLERLDFTSRKLGRTTTTTLRCNLCVSHNSTSPKLKPRNLGTLNNSEFVSNHTQQGTMFLQFLFHSDVLFFSAFRASRRATNPVLPSNRLTQRPQAP